MLKELLSKSVEKEASKVLLLSGGLDSSILASISKPQCSVTVALGNEAPDLQSARVVAKKYGLGHLEVILTEQELIEIIEQVIRIFKTFDPMEIRNTCVVFAGISKAKKEGYREVMTGDGSDELFAGYNYLRRYFSHLSDLDAEVRRLWSIMDFSSKLIGKVLKMDIRLPFLQDEFATFAKSINIAMKVGAHSGQLWGKFLLRKCFEAELGEDVVWKPKFPQETGAGIQKIKDFLCTSISDSTFDLGRKCALSDGVRIRDKEHLRYYQLFRKFFPIPGEHDCPHERCPECLGCLPRASRFCKTCGAFPIVSS
jgi:asparagine synthase (glutamine-hydrolysing)